MTVCVWVRHVQAMKDQNCKGLRPLGSRDRAWIRSWSRERQTCYCVAWSLHSEMAFLPAGRGAVPSAGRLAATTCEPSSAAACCMLHGDGYYSYKNSINLGGSKCTSEHRHMLIWFISDPARSTTDLTTIQSCCCSAAPPAARSIISLSPRLRLV